MTRAPEAAGRAAGEADGERTLTSPAELASTLHSEAESQDAPYGVSRDGPLSDLTLGALLGQGGVGQVWRATQRSLGRDVAVKRPHTGSGPAAARAMVREARITGALEHPSVVPIHGLVIDEAGVPMVVMKRISGASLEELLRAPSHPTWAALGFADDVRAGAVSVLAQVAAAVAFAHDRGVLHRDLKPANVMVGDFGEVYLVDWGLAVRLEELPALPRDLLSGTPAYMAPEMASPALGELGPRTDVYLLGAMLHEVLVGDPPHAGTGLLEVLRLAMASPPRTYPKEVPEELAALCSHAMARAPGERPASATAFRAALLSYLRHRGTSALLTRARERLVELTALPTDAAGAIDLAAETRFALMQARSEWPEAPELDVLHDTLVATLIRRAIARGEATAAQDLLAELRSPHEALRGEVALLVERAAADAARARQLEAMERDLDPRVDRGPRSLLLAITAITFLATTALASQPWVVAPSIRIVVTAAFVLGATSLAVALTRRWLLSTSFNRTFVGAVLTCEAAVFFHRVVGLAHGSAASDVVLGDMCIILAMLVTLAFSTYRWLLWFALVEGLCVLAAGCLPRVTFEIYQVSSSALFAAAALALLRSSYRTSRS